MYVQHWFTHLPVKNVSSYHPNCHHLIYFKFGKCYVYRGWHGIWEPYSVFSHTTAISLKMCELSEYWFSVPCYRFLASRWFCSHYILKLLSFRFYLTLSNTSLRTRNSPPNGTDHFPCTPISFAKMKFSLSIFDFQIPLRGLYNISKIGNNTWARLHYHYFYWSLTCSDHD